MNSPHHLWLPPPRVLNLNKNRVHVWRASLDLPPARIERLQSTLDADELERASRFCLEVNRAKFIAGRGILKDILSRYLHLQPQQVRFCYAPHGKPALASPLNTRGIQFNLSHSSQLALCAIATERKVGIDIEYMNPDIEFEEIAQHAFSVQEIDTLRRLPESTKLKGFYDCWTRKEAYIKAKGQGMSISTTRFDVSLTPGLPPILLKTRDDPHSTSHWSLHELIAGCGYAASLIVEGTDFRLEWYQWHGE